MKGLYYHWVLGIGTCRIEVTFRSWFRNFIVNTDDHVNYAGSVFGDWRWLVILSQETSKSQTR